MIPNPDKNDECDPDNMLSCLVSDYYSIEKLNKVIVESGPKALFFLHLKVSRLPKNIGMLNDIIYSFDSKPDIIPVSVTRLTILKD